MLKYFCNLLGGRYETFYQGKKNYKIIHSFYSFICLYRNFYSMRID